MVNWIRTGRSSPRFESESGGIGRRAGFRFQWGNPWEFESPLSHQLSGHAVVALAAGGVRFP